MCGIAGFLYGDTGGVTAQPRDTGRRMIAALHHRGPDSEGVWVDQDAGVVLAHARLAILDLSPAGQQPMFSPSGRFVLVFNGEIYNFGVLRKRLEQTGRAPAWRGTSDTEVLLAAFEAWGLDKTLRATVGMFALALWDREERVLYLARDRMGEKPLYYGWQQGVFLFGSELKALRRHPAFHGEIDRDALTLYLRYNRVPTPLSIYKGVAKLEPGHYLRIAWHGKRSAEKPVAYWRLEEAIQRGKSNPFAGDDREAVAELTRLLKESIRGQMIADVPLGAFLSGGYDSSTVVALMQSQSGRPVKTFTIGFHEEKYNEAEHAKAVAAHLGTEHTELYVAPRDALGVIPELPKIWDEPFSDSSQIPTLLVARLTRQHVTVSLSGDGGDELFFGYRRYLKGRLFRKLYSVLPSPGRLALAGLLRHAPGGVVERLQAVLPHRYRIPYLADRLPKLAEVLGGHSPEDFYRHLVSHAKEPAALVRGSREPATLFDQPQRWPKLDNFEEFMMYMDSITYLPDDILVKIDRATMAVGLEARVPLLDHRIVEFAWRLPLRFRFRDGKGKWLLRQVLYQYVPERLMDRPKMGFGVPLEQWLRGPLRPWAEDLLSERRLEAEGFFHPRPIRRMWEDHVSDSRRWHYYLWDVLMFQAWLEHQGKAR